MRHIRLITGALCALAGGVVVAITAGQSLADDDGRGEASPRNQCVSAPLQDSQVIDRETLLLTDRRGNAVLLKMAGPCMSPHEAIGIEYFGSSRVCDRMDVTITGDVASAVPMRCMIDSVTPLSKEEAAEYKRSH